MQNPTPEQIRERCLEIQAAWSPQDRRLRKVNRPKYRPAIKEYHSIYVQQEVRWILK